MEIYGIGKMGATLALGCLLMGFQLSTENQIDTALRREWTFSLTAPEKAVVVIENYNKKQATFYLDINGDFFLTKKKMVDKIRQQARFKSTLDCGEAFYYVYHTSWHHNQKIPVWNPAEQDFSFSPRKKQIAPPIPEKWAHHPALFINSIGMGYCDDRASTLALLWKEMGYPSRVWDLKGHVVPEVNYDNKWRLFDPDLGVYYLDSLGEIVGVKEVASGAYELAVFGHTEIARTNISHLPESLAFNVKYYSETDKKETDWFTSEIPALDTNIVLPSFSKIEYFIYAEMLEENARFLKVTVFPGSTGNLYIPLLLYRIIGNSHFNYADHKYSTAKKEVNNLYLQFPDTIQLTQVQDTTVFYYKINPLLPGLQRQNTLILLGWGIEGIQFRTSKRMNVFRTAPYGDFNQYMYGNDLSKEIEYLLSTDLKKEKKELQQEIKTFKKQHE